MEKITYSALEVANLLGISKSKVYDLLRNGTIPCLYLGKRIVVPIAKFNEWLEKGAV